MMFLFYQPWISLLHFPEPRVKRKTVLKDKCFIKAYFIVSNNVFVNWCNTGGRSRRKCPSNSWVCLWKLSKRRVRLSSLQTFIDELPSLSAMADLCPSTVLGCNFLSWNRYIRKPAIDFIVGAPKFPGY